MASKKSARERLYKPPAEQRQHIAKQQQQATGRIVPTPGAPRTVLKSYTPPAPTPLHYQDVGPVPPAMPPIELEMQALPEPVTPGPPRQVWTPFVDPTRVSTTSSRLPERRLWTGPRGNDVNVGDILPNLQEAWRPLFRPQEVYEELTGGASEEAIETTRQELIEQSRTWNPLKSLPAAVQAFRLRGPAGVGIAGAPKV